MTEKQYDFFINGKPLKKSDTLNVPEIDNFDKFALSVEVPPVKARGF